MREVLRVCLLTGLEEEISLDRAMRELLLGTGTVAERALVLTMLCAERVLHTDTHSYRLLAAEVVAHG
jgi:hypothetical protein